MTCITQNNICIVRGDSFAMDVGLSRGFEEVHEDPTGFVGRLVVRLEQADDLPNLLTLTAVPEPSDCECDPTVAYLRFDATVDQTQALPPYDLVYFVELATAGPPDGVTRLFQGTVDIHD